jgi:hypothetical protein
MRTVNNAISGTAVLKVIIPVCVLLFSGCTSSKPTAPAHHDSLEQALSQAASERVWHVTIFYIPERILPIEAIDEYRLEHLYSGCITIGEFQRSALRSKLLATLKESTMTPKQDVSQDFRWGCVFYDINGRRLLSLYFTAGSAGRVNDIPVETDGKLPALFRDEFKWLTNNW